MDIRYKDNKNVFQNLNGGDVFRLAQGSVLYMKTFEDDYHGSNAISLDKGNKQKINKDKEVVKVKCYLMVEET